VTTLHFVHIQRTLQLSLHNHSAPQPQRGKQPVLLHYLPHRRRPPSLWNDTVPTEANTNADSRQNAFNLARNNCALIPVGVLLRHLKFLLFLSTRMKQKALRVFKPAEYTKAALPWV
jgi:hypothetical protein